VTLSWEPPLSDGGGEITGYFVEKQAGYSSRWVPVNRAPVSLPLYTVRDVAEGEDCEFRVMAANEAGVGPPSQSTGVVRPRDLVTKPGQPGPLAIELDASRKVAELRWTKPKDDGRSPITNYVVEIRSNKTPRWKVSFLRQPSQSESISSFLSHYHA
jgi:titin